MAGVCPPGYILRKGYTRKFRNTTKKEGYLVHKFGKVYTVKPKKNVTYVSSACIKNRGLPGKGPREGEGFASLRKGELIKYGYSYRLAKQPTQYSLWARFDGVCDGLFYYIVGILIEFYCFCLIKFKLPY
jgi:hypothetical protein